MVGTHGGIKTLRETQGSRVSLRKGCTSLTWTPERSRQLVLDADGPSMWVKGQAEN